jgi:hypothetical protein
MNHVRDVVRPPCLRQRCGLPPEPVRVGERPGVAVNHEPVRSGALGRDAGHANHALRPRASRFLTGFRLSSPLRYEDAPPRT